MPGIAGIIGKGVSIDSRQLVARMIECMRHEASYVDQVEYTAECQACVGWIAHANSFASQASESSSDGLALAFAGECFNLTGSGNDPNEPEKILDNYRRNGSIFVRELNGLFSGVLLDRNTRRTFLFLDRYASERLYYHQSGGTLYFASEAKALLAVLPELRAFDPEGVADFLAFGSCRSTRTLFKGITRVAGASLWVFESGEVTKQTRYFDPSEWERLEPLSVKAFEAAFVETARSVVPRFAQADHEIGLSITGGLDTRMIMACLPAEAAHLVCYTYGAAEGDTLDVSIGRKIANDLGYVHQTLRINDDFVSGFQDYLDQSIYVSDGCATALTAHELFFSEMAQSIAPVRLTGNFGSELLRSMSTLKPLFLVDGLIEGEFAARIDNALAPNGHVSPLSGTVFDEVPSHLFGPLAIARSKLIFRTPFLDNSLVRLAFQAPEYSRQTPFAALRLIATGPELLGKMPSDLGFSCGRYSPLDVGRRIFRKISFKLDYWDKEGLPPKLAALDACRPILQQAGLLGQHKFLPYRRWFREELRDIAEGATKRVVSGNQPWWNPRVVANIAADHASGRRNHLKEINAILTLDAVERILISSSDAFWAGDQVRKCKPAKKQ